MYGGSVLKNDCETPYSLRRLVLSILPFKTESNNCYNHKNMTLKKELTSAVKSDIII